MKVTEHPQPERDLPIPTHTALCILSESNLNVQFKGSEERENDPERNVHQYRVSADYNHSRCINH